MEYELFARITRRLSQTWPQRKENYPAFVAAVTDNLTLWRTLAVDVADAENGLPKPLRAQLFYLHEFTAAHTQKVLNKAASVEVLVDINTAVMKGLRGNGGSE